MGWFGKGDWGLKILSVILAVVLWVYVSNELNPTKYKEFKAVPVEVKGVGQNLAVSEMPGTVNVRVQANQNLIADLDVRSIEVYVDLTRVKPGETVVPVRVKAPTGVKVADLRPRQMPVKIESMAEKQVLVQASYLNSPKEGYKLLAVKTKPDEVIIRGPKSVIDRVTAVSIDIQLKDREKSFGETLPIKVVDDTGNFREERFVTRTPSVVDVFITIVPDLPVRKVKVNPQITGTPAAGYTVLTTVIEPEELNITGEPEAINGIDRVSTQPVNISGAKEDVYTEVGPDLPQGVSADRQSLRVLVKIGPD
ncbi:CdaR family protein [Phosphitispora fastidiosa]|uniref:CdaR family protein n=1 Tax=Phosphitispora fastidiosa TaxID=2837202 RepID=UPI001E376536|nr:YbbR domain-containing protein [Phosphitispora fastidiosa]